MNTKNLQEILMDDCHDFSMRQMLRFHPISEIPNVRGYVRHHRDTMHLNLNVIARVSIFPLTLAEVLCILDPDTLPDNPKRIE